MIITLWELMDIAIMTLFVGFLFSGHFGRTHSKNYMEDPVSYYEKESKSLITSEMKTAIIVSAPALIAHELAHKFVAMAFGVSATFHAFYADSTSLILGVLAMVAKLTGFGFMFIIPGFVSICEGALTCPITPFQGAFIAFAGPMLNGILWIGSWAYLKWGKPEKHYLPILVFTKQINMFLFFFNLIPFGPFDGASVLRGLVQGFSG